MWKLFCKSLWIRASDQNCFICPVLKDIVRTMFSKSFIDELMKPQDLYSHQAVRYLLTRLAHTSIMRLDSTSMDRVSKAQCFLVLQCYSCWWYKSGDISARLHSLLHRMAPHHKTKQNLCRYYTLWGRTVCNNETQHSL